MTRMWTACMATLAIGAIGCGGGGGDTDTDGQEASAQYAGPLTSNDVARGQEVFTAICASCHSEGHHVLENIAWTPARVRQQVREGSGHMPAIREPRVSGADLEAVLAYLVTIGGVADEGAAPATGGGEEPAATEDAPAEETETATDA